MALTLGIHIGHHASCAVVQDGVLLSALQLERLSRKKYHVLSQLSNELPIAETLAAANVRLDDVDLIVSSFAAASPGGIGLGRRLVASDFSLFDPWEDRHRIISHHLAHAHSAFEASGLTSAAVLVCDYAGSTTLDGNDFDEPFPEWLRSAASCRDKVQPQTEWLSFYKASVGRSYKLCERRFCVAHPQQDVFVHHLTGLYENVSAYIFNTNQAHGQVMALAAHGEKVLNTDDDPGCLFGIDEDGEPLLRNDWQHRLPMHPNESVKAALAYRCQEAAESIMCNYAERARRLAGEDSLCLAGGLFLNILGNTAIWRAGDQKTVFVPSAPHDAGIAIGCAYAGWRRLAPNEKPRRVQSDALGPGVCQRNISTALERYESLVESRPVSAAEIACLLDKGKIVARAAGRSEFGPRALGHRSLLGDPRDPRIKTRLNEIKGRQAWRPVAPIVAANRAPEFFDGPPESPWMNMSYTIRPDVRELLGALWHPDHSTRPQTVERAHDPELYELLLAFESYSGLPILLNTSLNRQGEPIVEAPSEALAMFLDKKEIDYLVLDGNLISRKPSVDVETGLFRLREGSILTRSCEGQSERLCLICDNQVWLLDASSFDALGQACREPISIIWRQSERDATTTLLDELVRKGVLLPV